MPVQVCTLSCLMCHGSMQLIEKRPDRTAGGVSPLMKTTLQPEDWDHNPVELSDAWILSKGEKVARCMVLTHELGWELRLLGSDLVRSHVCRSAPELLDTLAAWKAAMLRGGWTELPKDSQPTS